ncbi:hypothetical protein G6O67_005651 [Ophiocordyceps sinensis]|uniref:Infection structure specific protein n=2 Tax=Ophiocordyceps sinensis TaxID=72228 RepID=A0A8H4LXD1_9HYPO|nr:hypothetical protein OCS_03924 [Ophiocordyceps sinensis CO18]KAF4506971.1 hypothetical protein G6O67_005651 [Ophiocordyceps sinensis]
MRLQLLSIALAASATKAQQDIYAPGASSDCSERLLSLVQATPTAPPALSALAADSDCVPTSLAQPASDFMAQIASWSSSVVQEASACPPFASSASLLPSLPTWSVCGDGKGDATTTLTAGKNDAITTSTDGTNDAITTSTAPKNSSKAPQPTNATNGTGASNSTTASQSNVAARDAGPLFAVAAAAVGLAAMVL